MTKVGDVGDFLFVIFFQSWFVTGCHNRDTDFCFADVLEGITHINEIRLL
jgi:hypothetical protein